MKIVKNKIHNKMSDDFFINSLIILIKKEIIQGFDINSVIDAFNFIKDCRPQLKILNLRM